MSTEEVFILAPGGLVWRRAEGGLAELQPGQIFKVCTGRPRKVRKVRLGDDGPEVESEVIRLDESEGGPAIW